MISVSLNWAFLIGALALCGAASILAMLTYFTTYLATAVVLRVYRASRRRWSRRH
jgi:hypothetical protein